jgi:phosphohistidine swiveling domain-containing protein
VAVVIQKMVDADKSGVAFSVHPITEDEDQMIIEAGFGLGEAIVSGAVTPDSYVFSKSENEAIDIKINNQKQALYRSQKSEDGEFNEWVTLEVKKAISQVLSDLEIQVLASDILNIEKHYGFPCDIEWAKEGDRFYITQSRPITTISRSKKDDPVKWKKVWEAGNAPVFEMTHGTVLAYSDMKELGLVDFDLQIVGSKKKISAFHSEEGLMKSAARGYRYFLSEKGDEFLVESRKLIDLSYGFIDGTDFKYQAGELDTFKETSNLIRKVFAFFNLTNPQFLSKLEQEVLFEIKSTAGLDSGGIFRDLCVSEKISSLQSEQAAWMNLVSSVSEEKFHEKEIEVLISDHHQAFGSLVGDEGNSAWDEQYFKRLLEKDLKSEINYKNEIEAINQYSDDILKLKRNHVEVHGLSSDLVSRTELLSDLGHVRLELRSAWTALFHKLREVLKDISDVHGISQDILLDYNADEIIEFLEKRAELVKKPDEFSVGFVNDEWDVGFGGNAVKQESIYVGNTKSLENGELVGSTAFPGFVTGKAVVLDWGSDDFEEKITNFPKDGILVAGQTRPMLVPAIRIASAIVTDEGGITSHAAIVAREFKKPCVIGTVLATESIKDGDTIEVDADNGLVRIIKIKKPSVVSEDL